MKAYTVAYKLHSGGDVKKISFLAESKIDAYGKAVYSEIPKIENTIPYSAWVYSVTYNNGNYKRFNTFEGMPY